MYKCMIYLFRGWGVGEGWGWGMSWCPPHPLRRQAQEGGERGGLRQVHYCRGLFCPLSPRQYPLGNAVGLHRDSGGSQNPPPPPPRPPLPTLHFGLRVSWKLKLGGGLDGRSAWSVEVFLPSFGLILPRS